VAKAQAAFMLTSATVKYLEEHEADECDCPACMPACERTGKRCFILCDRCKREIETDEFGPLKSQTRRVRYPASTTKHRLIAVGPETNLIRMLNAIED
jgi:predicted amidophosphoribosyltransferase